MKSYIALIFCFLFCYEQPGIFFDYVSLDDIGPVCVLP